MQALVVADRATQNQLQDFFLRREHGVELCDSLTEARAAIEKRSFPFVVLDLAGDQAGALELCREIRARPDGESTYILVLPAAETPGAMRAALRAGADDYLVKPIREPALKLRLAIGHRVVSSRTGADARLERSERRYRTLVETMSEGLFEVDQRGTIEYANSRLSEITGYTQDELVGARADELLVDDRVRRRLPGQTLLGTGTGSERYAIPLRAKSGEELWVNLTAAPLAAIEGGEGGSVGLVEDVTGQHTAEEGLRLREAALKRERALFEQLFRNSPSGIVILDNSDRVVDVNRAFVDLFQYEVEELAGRLLHDFIVPDNLRDEAEQLSELVKQRQSVERETVRRRKDGSAVDVAILAYSIELQEQRIGGFGLYSDITERKKAERKLFYDAFHDALTGLPNRTLLAERLERDLRRAKRRADYQFALLFLDLDRFKRINDNLGHAAGDELLRQVARRLEGCLRPGDTTARLGGDEFTVILEDVPGSHEAAQVAERILAAFAQPFLLAGHEQQASGSIGIAFSSSGYERVEDLMRDADIAMYRAKSRGRGRYEIFDRDMQSSEVELKQLRRELSAALDEDQLVLYYQPVISLATGGIVGFEALVRWLHPEGGLRLPAELIPACRQTGLVPVLGRWVLAAASRQLAAWQERFPDSDALLMSVNLSLEEVVNPLFFSELDRIVAETGIRPAAVSLEVAEEVTAAEDAAELLWQIDRRGFRLAIDDFGTGRTSLDALHRLPVSSVKIDRSFIELMSPGEAEAEVVRAAAALGASLGLAVVAEGVESREQLERLRALGVGFAQGFLFSPPLPAAAAEVLIAEDRRW